MTEPKTPKDLEEQRAPEQDYILSNKLYDRLKLLALVILPALGTLYFGLAGIWGLPAAEQVSGTIVVLVTFLGVLIKVGDASYNASEAKYAGVLDINHTGRGGRNFTLQLNGDPTRLEDEREIIFRVSPPGSVA